jgi:hypothetical protein
MALTEMPNTIDNFYVFHRDPHPDVVGPMNIRRDLRQAMASLGEDLECVLGALIHDVEDPFDEGTGDVLVKQVAHGIDKDNSRAAPLHWDIKNVKMCTDRES